MESMNTIYSGVQGFFKEDLAQNSPTEYLIALSVLCGGLVLVFMARGFVSRVMQSWIEHAGRYGRVDRVLVSSMVTSALKLLPLIPIYFALKLVVFSAPVTRGINFIFFLAFTFGIVRFLSNFAVFLLDASLRKESEDISQTSPGAIALAPIVRTIVWALGLTFVLDNLGFQVTSIVAGLGIMGVAIGLAGQAILADFFSYLVILLDKPFTIGDFINAGTTSGTVEHIGIKTTRIRTALGEVRVCPNGELVKQPLGNLGPAERRARVLNFGITYETPLEKVKVVPNIVAEVAANVTGLTIDRIHFLNFGTSSLDFELSLSVAGNNGLVLLQATNDFNIQLMERFAKEGINFAYPTQRLFCEKSCPVNN